MDEIRELHDGLRLRRRLKAAKSAGEEYDERQLEEIDHYVELLTRYGHGEPDHIQHSQGDDGPILTVTYARASDLWRAVKRNINKSGVFVQTDQFPSIDTTLELHCEVQWPAFTIRRPAKVIWVNPQERAGRPMGMGLKFLWRSDDEAALFKAYLVGDEEPGNLARLG